MLIIIMMMKSHSKLIISFGATVLIGDVLTSEGIPWAPLDVLTPGGIPWAPLDGSWKPQRGTCLFRWSEILWNKLIKGLGGTRCPSKCVCGGGLIGGRERERTRREGAFVCVWTACLFVSVNIASLFVSVYERP